MYTYLFTVTLGSLYSCSCLLLVMSEVVDIDDAIVSKLSWTMYEGHSGRSAVVVVGRCYTCTYVVGVRNVSWWLWCGDVMHKQIVYDVNGIYIL